MGGTVRYAIYFCPRPDTALAAFGKSWFGYDIETGQVVPRLISNLPDHCVAQPRRYGFHGTLKAPFALAGGASEDGLIEAVGKLCADSAPVEIGPLKMKQLGMFLCLMPRAQPDELTVFALRCVQVLDRFRADLTEAEIARRTSAGLSPVQKQMLYRWGYPYVGDAFRFHLTLTGPLPRAELAHARDTLERPVDGALAEPVLLEDLCVCADPGNGEPFRLKARVPLTGPSDTG